MARLTGPVMGTPGDSTRRTTSQELPLGTIAYGPGTEWVYIKAGASIAAYDGVRFQGSASGYDDVRPTSATDQGVIGVADAAFASGEYGFVQTRGVATAKVVNATAAGSILHSGATAGTLELAVAASDLHNKAIVALVTGVATGSAVCLL